MKKKLLVVVDMQNDFIDGSLGTKEAQTIVPNVVRKITDWADDIVFTKDTHYSDYLETREGKHLPIEHCIINTDGHKIREEVLNASQYANSVVVLNKKTFGSYNLVDFVREKEFVGTTYNYIELIGLCTDICVVSNAILLKNAFPEIDIVVDASCCAGVIPETHDAALKTMKMCQIDIIGG